MKLVLSAVFALALLPLSAQAAPNFSAFSIGDDLHVTVMGDTCNHFGGNLKVEPLCLEGRMTMNFAEVCEATLDVYSTMMACEDESRVPRTITLSLKEAKLTSEARLLKLNYGGEVIEVQLDRQ